MPHEQVLFSSAAREKVLRGATTLADAVRITFGAQVEVRADPEEPGDASRLQRWGDDRQGVEPQGPRREPRRPDVAPGGRADRGARGDGTCTSTILAQAILAEDIKNIVAGPSAIDIKRGLERGLKFAVEALPGLSRPAQSRREKTQVAMISAHNARETGEIVAEAREKLGNGRVVSVEEAKSV